MPIEMKKQINEAFNKKLYYLGKDEDGINHWLEEPQWACGWYWAFGYIETYTNNDDPSIARDILSHSHYDTMLLSCHNGVFRHIFKDITGFKSPLTEQEQWALSDLMKQFYCLKEAAEVFGRGHSNYSERGKSGIKDTDLAERINKEMLPKVFQAVIRLLSPQE